MKLEQNDFWQTHARGSNDQEYQLYLDLADDGNGMDILTDSTKELKTYEEWMNS